MSEYNIPVLVKFRDSIPMSWNPKMTEYMGTVIHCRKLNKDSVIGPQYANNGGWAWFGEHVIPNPTPSQIEEEARKAGKAPVTTKPLVDPMTVDWQRSDFAVGMAVMLKPDQADYVKDKGIRLGIPHTIKRYDGAMTAPFWIVGDYEKEYCFNVRDLVPLSKIREYEAAQSAQKGPMDPKQVKPPKPTICEVALRAARERVDGLALLKDTQDRIKNAKASLAKDTKDRRAVIAQLEAEAATLSKKWLKGVGK